MKTADVSVPYTSAKMILADAKMTDADVSVLKADAKMAQAHANGTVASAVRPVARAAGSVTDGVGKMARRPRPGARTSVAKALAARLRSEGTKGFRSGVPADSQGLLLRPVRAE